MKFEFAGTQIDGARDYQEDAFLITHLADKDGKPVTLVIVADGMGGHAAGNVASNMAVQVFNKHISSNYPTDELGKVLQEAVIQTNLSIQETVQETPALKGMGCTMVAGVLEEGRLWWASVGDSHLYLIRDGGLIKKNADHSYGGFIKRMKQAGTPVKKDPDLSENMLMSALTGDDISEVDVSDAPVELQLGDKILFCSDGLDSLDHDKILKVFEAKKTAKECVDALMQAIEKKNLPRQDNATAIVVEVCPSAPAKSSAAKADGGSPQQKVQQLGMHPLKVEGLGFWLGRFLKFATIIGVIGLAVGYIYLHPEVLTQMRSWVSGSHQDDTSQAAPTVVKAPDQKETTEAGQAAKASIPASVEPVDQDRVETSATVPQPATDKKIIQDSLKLVGGKGPKMVIIPAGKFSMGGSDSSPHVSERPRHRVTVGSFAVSQYEISFAEYERFARSTGRRIPRDLGLNKKTHPVVFVSWDDAFYYTKWLSKQTGKKYRLLNEAEWEYMASTGKKSSFWWGYAVEENRAHCFGCGSGLDPRRPARIGSFSANAFNVYDTAGNVGEWVHDCWHQNYRGAPDMAEVWEGGDCSLRVVRGGNYTSPPTSIRSAKRDKYKSDAHYDHIGIRVARDL